MSEESKFAPFSAMANDSQHLATLLARDIRRRGLRAGDRYLTDKQAAQMLQVSQVAAHRAMRQLAQRKLVVRRRRAGTFIGPDVDGKLANKLQCVHFLLPARLRFKGAYPVMAVLEGIRSELPETQVQLNFVSPTEPMAFLRQLVDHTTDSGVMTGIVLASTTRQIRQFFNGRSLPVVVSGHIESDIDLPWVDRDQNQIGHLLAGHLLERGHQRVALIMRDLWAPGDNLMADGVSRVLSTGSVTLMVRCTPQEVELTEDIIHQMLDCSDRPTGIICRSESQALCAARAAEQLGLSIPNDLEIVAANIPPDSTESIKRFPHTSFDPEAFGATAGRMIAQWSRGERPEPYHHEIPVCLEIPPGYQNSPKKP